MKARSWKALTLGLVFLAMGTGRAVADDDDPEIKGTRLSKLVAMFKAAKTGQERSDLALAIADGKEKAKSAVPVLAAALNDKEFIVRVNIVNALGTIGPAAKAAVPDLIAALKDTNAYVRGSAATALGSIGPAAKAAVPALSDIVKDTAQPAAFRAAAAHGLGGIGSEAKDAVPLLTEALKDKAGSVRVASAGALYAIDKKNVKLVVPVLREGLKDKDESAQTTAVMTLKAIGPEAKDAVPDLLALAAKGGMAAYYAPEALGEIPAAEAVLIAALKDPDKRLQETAAAVLKKYYPEAAKKAGLTK